MLWLLRWLAWSFFRVLLALRYRVRIRGKAEVLKHPGPYLILPNHPAYIGPAERAHHGCSGRRSRCGRWLLETNFQNPILGPIAACSVARSASPTRRRASADAREARPELAVTDGGSTPSRPGDNVILWPSGHLIRDGTERLGGSTRRRGHPGRRARNDTIVLVRTRGLWGSMFSWAPTATKPKLGGGW